MGQTLSGDRSLSRNPRVQRGHQRHPDERRYKLQLALAEIAGDKKEQAKLLLDELIAQGNTSAMLSLAFISPDAEAAELMHKAAAAGDPNAMMLFAMAQLTGKGVAKNEIDGIRMLGLPPRTARRAPCSSSAISIKMALTASASI